MTASEDFLCTLAEFIFDTESLSDKQEVTSYADGVIRISDNGAVRRLIGFATAEDCEKKMQSLKRVALDLPEVDDILVFYTGARTWAAKPRALPDRSMRLGFVPIANAWFFYGGLRDGQSDLGVFVCKEYSDGLALQLRELAPGDGPAHEALLRCIFAFAFPSCISWVDVNKRTVDGEQVRDLLLRIKPNSRLQHYVRDSHRTSNTIVVEAKNEQKNNGAAISQLEGYLGYYRTADVGILVTRKPLGPILVSEAMRGRRERAPSALVVPIADEQLQLVLQNSAASAFHKNEALMIAWISDAIDKRP
jgi:hypothetical protein